MLKQALLVAGVLAFATSASALEVTHPFYGPAKGGIASTTSYEFATATTKGVEGRSKVYTHNVKEALSYGLTDAVSLDASVGNTFAKTHGDHDDKNVSFELGSTWNVLTGPTKLQVKGAYGQDEAHDLDGAYKYVKAGVKAGHTIGIYTPYVAGTAELPVAQQHNIADNHAKYEAKAAVYAYCPRMKTAVDTGVRVNYDEWDESRTFAYDLEASYYLTKNVAVSAFGSYTFGGKAKYGTDLYGESVGARLRVAF